MRANRKRVLLAFSLSSIPPALLADTQILEAPLLRGVLIPEVSPSEPLGSDVAGIGDFNGDGVDDFAIAAAPFFPGSPSSAVYIVPGRTQLGGMIDLSTDPGTLRIGTSEPTFGVEVLAAGDMDSDGLGDVLIHQLVDVTLALRPRMYLLYGSSDLPPSFDKDKIGASIRGAVLEGDSLPAFQLASPIALLEDFNGDGVPDLAFANVSRTSRLGERGLVSVLFGKAFDGTVDVETLIDGRGGLRIWGSQRSDGEEPFGYAIASAGDANGDGLTDLVAADPRHSNLEGEVRGRMCLIYGSRSSLPTIQTDELGSRGVILENDEELDPEDFGMFALGGEDAA